ncbi:MAG: UvrB/UvrC motif-containing protein, partial [Candidatus Thermoplasmatota archaeon]|nr:UvrB/UvrC motif-containing protein [Candidatus Thermoplasmatota archaeon]
TIIKPIKEKIVEIKDTRYIPKNDIPQMIIELELQMKKAADDLDFEKAIMLRDKISRLKKTLNR